LQYLLEREIGHSRDSICCTVIDANQIVFGAVLLIIGVLITAATYGSASQSGGTYIVAYGPMIVGVIKIVRGLGMLGG